MGRLSLTGARLAEVAHRLGRAPVRALEVSEVDDPSRVAACLPEAPERRA
jgi:hypothetical protein